jgi:16S rRNA (cytosine967-C5)-methyltransferase
VTVGVESPRRVALDALLRVEEGAFAHLLVPEMLRRRRLDSRDRGFVTELVYGTVRMQRAVDHLLGQVSSRPIDDLDPRVRGALRLGAYQLLVGMPPHAAVGETVNLAGARTRGFVNGVLRALARLGPPWPLPTADDIESIGIRTSHPDWIVTTLFDMFGVDDAIATLELDDEPPPVTLRVNRMRSNAEELAGELRQANVEVARGDLVADALLVRHSGDLAALAAVRDGRASPQDQASQAIVAVLDPRPGERILDLASAPGGKTCAAAERMGATGLVVAADVRPARVHTVMEAAARLGLTDAIVTVLGDGVHPPVRNGVFDRVLLDAPCSGLGVLRRRPDARWRIRPSDVVDLAALQRVLLAAAACAVRPGGRLVYSVCTLTRAETLEIDEWAAAQLPELHAIDPPGPPWRPYGRGALLLPSDARSDGMFVLVFERRIALAPAPVAPVVAEEIADEPPEPVAEQPPPPPPPAPASKSRWARVE